MSGEGPAGDGKGDDRLRNRLAGVVETVRAVVALTSRKQLSLLAAAIAYYAFVSTVPLVVLGVAVATTVGGDALAERLVAQAGSILAPAGQELLRTAVTDRAGIGGVTVAGVAVLGWGALKAFRAMDGAFSLVYGTEPSAMPGALVDAAVVLLAVGSGAGTLLLAGTAVSRLPGPVVGLVGTVGLSVTLVVLFLPVYYWFPDAPLTVRQVLPGTALAAVGWTVLGGAFQLYTAFVAGRSIYGLLGAVLLGLTWLYLGALVLLLGAAVNAVRSGHAAPVDR